MLRINLDSHQDARPAPRLRRAAWVALILFLLAPGTRSDSPQQWFDEGRDVVQQNKRRKTGRRAARNVILFVGDGMGVSTVAAARILEGQLRGEDGEENLLEFERFPHLALAKTYNTNQQVGDSAGCITALITGVKTAAGLLSLSQRAVRGDVTTVAGNELATIVEQAERRGLSTGLVTTTRVTHATPAGLYAHSPERWWEDDSLLPPDTASAGFKDIARQLIEFPAGDGMEVVLGGGRRGFLPAETADPEYADRTGQRLDGRDLTAEWAAEPDAAYVWNAEQLASLDLGRTSRLLGLFEPTHLRYETERQDDPAGEPSLTEMTRAAIRLLAPNRKGFFLLVEAGRIDHGHHDGNAYRALTETLELARAVRAAREMTDARRTLIVVTADHSHALNFMGYPTRGNDILGKVVRNDLAGRPESDWAHDALGLPYTTLGYYAGAGYTGRSAEQPEGIKRFPHHPTEYRGIEAGRPDLTSIDTTDPGFLQETALPMPDAPHSGEDVAVYATGPGADLLGGVIEQNVIYHLMAAALGLER